MSRRWVTKGQFYMQLSEFSYSENLGKLGEWSLEPFELENAMLVVGRNATGKSRTLAVIHSLAAIIRAKRLPSTGRFEATFRDPHGQTVSYSLEGEYPKVLSEQLVVDGKVLLSRRPDGSGTICAVLDPKPQELPFQIEEDALAVAAKRDRRLHPFLEPLHAWAEGVRLYPFGSHMGREEFAVLVKDAPPVDPSDWKRTVAVFLRGKKELGQPYIEAIKGHLRRLDYSIEDIDARQPTGIQLSQPLPGPLLGLAVQEKDLGDHWIDQITMSQGMFRALALMVHMTYALLAKKPSCVLLDDVGEGLDYKRSTLMIEILLELGKASGSQILMATNDRFVMNAVPLEHWAVLLRQGGKCRLLTYRNAREKFDSFREIGLNHFDLFSSGYLDDSAS